MVGLSSGPFSSAVRAAWAGTRLAVGTARYVFARLPPAARLEVAAAVSASEGFALLMAEEAELTVVVDEASYTGLLEARATAAIRPCRLITFDTVLESGLVGYLAPCAARLAAQGVAILPFAAYRTDHLLVRDEDVELAREALERLIAECRG